MKGSTLHNLAIASKESCPAFAQGVDTHTHSNIGLLWFSLFLKDNLFPNKQRPFVLPLPGHRDHWEDKGVGALAAGGSSVAQSVEWPRSQALGQGKVPGPGRRQNRLGITVSPGVQTQLWPLLWVHWI